MKGAPIRDIVGLFLVTRLLLFLVTYFGYILLTAYQYSSEPVDLATLSAFDYAFFPLFPLFIATIAQFLGSWSYLAVGIFLSNGALLGTLFMLYYLAADIGGEQVARRTLLYLSIFPSAFFFFAPYNESLFLLFTTGTFLALRRQRYWLAGLLGFLATLTHAAGILLCIPFLYELWVTRESCTTSLSRRLSGLLPVLLILLWILLYCLYCWQITGSPITFVQQPWQSLSSLFFWQQPFGSPSQVLMLLNLITISGLIILTFLGRHKLCPGLTLWNIVLILYILLNSGIEQDDPLPSNGRFVLILFPSFITLAFLSIFYPKLHISLQLFFIALSATFSLVFIMNH
jgi:Gpi18-like mannosyltransferase